MKLTCHTYVRVIIIMFYCAIAAIVAPRCVPASTVQGVIITVGRQWKERSLKHANYDGFSLVFPRFGWVDKRKKYVWYLVFILWFPESWSVQHTAKWHQIGSQSQFVIVNVDNDLGMWQPKLEPCLDANETGIIGKGLKNALKIYMDIHPNVNMKKVTTLINAKN